MLAITLMLATFSGDDDVDVDLLIVMFVVGCVMELIFICGVIGYVVNIGD